MGSSTRLPDPSFDTLSSLERLKPSSILEDASEASPDTAPVRCALRHFRTESGNPSGPVEGISKIGDRCKSLPDSSRAVGCDDDAASAARYAGLDDEERCWCDCSGRAERDRALRRAAEQSTHGTRGIAYTLTLQSRGSCDCEMLVWCLAVVARQQGLRARSLLRLKSQSSLSSLAGLPGYLPAAPDTSCPAGPVMRQREMTRTMRRSRMGWMIHDEEAICIQSTLPQYPYPDYTVARLNILIPPPLPVKCVCVICARYPIRILPLITTSFTSITLRSSSLQNKHSTMPAYNTKPTLVSSGVLKLCRYRARRKS